MSKDVQATLNRNVWDFDGDAVMDFRIFVPLDKVQNVKSAEERQKLMEELMGAMEKGMIEYQAFVNRLRADINEPPHDFGYPWKPDAV